MSNLAILDRTLASVPRSSLHALAPIGLSTPQVESLTSYFCRLVHSHACTTHDLSKFIIERIEPERWETHQGTHGKSRYLWYERSISGLGDAALSWAGMLAQLTSVNTLKHLTLLPLRGCVASKGLMANQARWCPQCFAADQKSGRPPYFRLAWDIGLNKVCERHNTALVARCPHCQKSNVRHTATFVVPGWCTACGTFLGSNNEESRTEPLPAQGGNSASTLEAERADINFARTRSISALLAVTSSPQPDEFTAGPDSLHQAVEHIINELDGGVDARFARRLGVRKSTIHYWRTSQTPVTMDTITRIALCCDIPLADLLQGKVDQWQPAADAQRQMALVLAEPGKRKPRERREHDWSVIRNTLRRELLQPKPRSVTEVAKSLSINTRLLYLQATQEARQLGEYHLRYRHEQASLREAALHNELKQACIALKNEGEGITVSEVEQRVGTKTINSTRHLYTVLTDLAYQAANDNAV
ncbi:MAG: hypothetical protein EPN31_04405 [Castellaniella sp.]|uniref:TniQ family protein n=1 Tax=Castellaniella sp. TaxID=1955812 RepID=UPI0011F73651|nr:TniQ family protein [Castellaniella sp.]TAN30321.1 MAG: hypothetical protein EPN31_04405 [Castellaniella sp.]